MVDKSGFKKLLQLYILLINIFKQMDEKNGTIHKIWLAMGNLIIKKDKLSYASS